jgi:acetolactate synthase-1/2/3 large subunit
MNIQREKISPGKISLITRKCVQNDTLQSKILELFAAIRCAQRPLLLVGRGVQSTFAHHALLQFIEKTHIPVVTSLLGFEVMPFHHPLRVGFIGTYGNRWANIALGNADLLIVMGSRLDIRQTGADVEGFRRGKTIFHIDCDQYEMNNRISGCIPILADVNEFLILANTELKVMSFLKHEAWLQFIQMQRAQYPDIAELKDFPGINPNVFMHDLSKVSQSAKAYVVDVGNHQMWAAQSLELDEHQLFLTSGGMGAMGFALPAAIGASYALNKQSVVAIIGDGAFQMNIQELQTIMRNNLPIRIIVINNNCLGMIRQFQDSYFNGRYQSTYWGYSAPDFSAIAKAYGLPALTISANHEIPKAMHWLKENDTGPHLLQVMISHLMNVYPKIAFGKPITEMEPFAKPIEMECT